MSDSVSHVWNGKVGLWGLSGIRNHLLLNTRTTPQPLLHAPSPVQPSLLWRRKPGPGVLNELPKV